MRRSADEVNAGPNRDARRNFAKRRARSIGALLALLSIAAVAACGRDEAAAERLYRESKDRVSKNDYAGAVERLDKIAADHPGSPLAEQARKDAILYRGLDSAVKLYPQRRAREILVQIARVVERYRAAKHDVPGSLTGLVPDWLDEVPLDPWGRTLVYQPKIVGNGYRLACLGADGNPGGSGDDADLVVVNGSFVEGGGAR